MVENVFHINIPGRMLLDPFVTSGFRYGWGKHPHMSPKYRFPTKVKTRPLLQKGIDLFSPNTNVVMVF